MCMSTKSDSSSLKTLSYAEKISVAFVLCAHESPLSVAHMDEALSSGNVEEVVHTLGFADLSLVFSEDGSENAVFVEDHSVSGLGPIEHHLLISHVGSVSIGPHPEKRNMSSHNHMLYLTHNPISPIWPQLRHCTQLRCSHLRHC